MATVRMVNPNDGKTYEFDKQYAEKYAAQGWTDAAAPSLAATAPAPKPPAAPYPTAMPAPDSPNYFREMGSTALPSAVAGTVTALMPEAGIPLRLLAALLTGTGAEVGAQAIRHEPISLPRAAIRGGAELFGQGVGEVAGAGVARVPAVQRGLAADAYATTGKLAPKTAGAGDFFTREGFRMGEKGTVAGTDAVENAIKASHAAEDAAVAAHSAQIRSGPVRELGKGVSPTVPQVNLSELASKAQNRVLDKFGIGLKPEERAELQALADEVSTRTLSNVGDRPIEIPQGPEPVLQLKRAYDIRSEPTYQKMDAGKPVAVSAIEQRFNKAVADEARAWLRDNVPGLGRQMQRTSELIRFKPAMTFAETRPSPKATLNPMKAAENFLNDRRRKAATAIQLQGPARVASSPAAVPIARQAPRALGLTLDEILTYLRTRNGADRDSL